MKCPDGSFTYAGYDTTLTDDDDVVLVVGRETDIERLVDLP